MIIGGGGHNNPILGGSKVSSDPDAPDNKEEDECTPDQDETILLGSPGGRG